MSKIVGNLKFLTQIEKSVLEPIAPPKPQHLCGTSTREAPSSLPQAAPQPILAWSCLPVKSPVGQLDENGILPVDHKINSNIETFRSRVRRAETELEMIAPKLKPQKTNEQICHVGTRECYNNNPRNIHDPYGYGPTGIQSNKGLSQNPPDLQHCFNSLCVADKICHWLEQG
ncbi:hypothetical protein BY996DRAFT_6616867 [Phakopsora pachyrhizi]|nr:hypothetical protein BY996DRAFT_6616867 [Phakopsora pachyrhizi]